MTYRLFLLLTLAACFVVCEPLRVHAQIQALQQETPSEPEPPEPPVWTLHPAAEPSPALDVRFWPDRMEMVPGNAFVPFQRAVITLLEQRAASGRGADNSLDAFYSNYETWMEGPLDEMPTEDVQKYLDDKGTVMREVHRAVRMQNSRYELGVDQLRGMETIQLGLPEIQNMRELARLLALESRLALAEGRYDDAIESMRVGFRLGEASGGAADLLVARLVGIAISAMMLGQAEQLMQMPDGPNLYWALASLPESIYSLDSAMQFEASLITRVFPTLNDLPEGATNTVWREHLVEMIDQVRALNEWGSSPEPAISSLAAGGLVIALTEPARQQLIASGRSEETVRAMSPSEAILRATADQIAVIQDEFFKWTLLPESIRADYLDRTEKAIVFDNRAGGLRFGTLGAILAGQLMPAIRAANSASLRMQQTIARMATVEAIRDYAATHGQLPESLDDLQNLPAWPDPVAGGPFGYERRSPTEAQLTSRPARQGAPDTTIILQLQTQQ
ncbi:hypothetical protein [Roseimaritima sediminicola]|uniref:hypothetical protein n=1 Tax=Roseimaritima sediminicola TaxID=2662066 RepID=UPI0012983A8A|nr:hypothetical protein [Roseimaritima sediminicola]